MTTLIISGNRLGLRMLGSGGRTAVTSYDQIARALTQLLGPDHSALFAEPNIRGPVIDWFTSFDTDLPAKRLVHADTVERQAGLGRLEILVQGVQATARRLRDSPLEADRVLGEMLAYALEIPGEDAVWLLGQQPVLTWWGHAREHGQPAENPLFMMIRRAAPPPAVVGPVPGGTRSRGEHPVARRLPLVASFLRRVDRVPPAALWAIFGALAVTIGLMLLRGCAIGLPVSLTGWLLNYCPGSVNMGLEAALSAERARQATLQAEYEELVREAALKRQACVTERPTPTLPISKPEPSPPTPPSAPEKPTEPHIATPEAPKQTPMIMPRAPEKGREFAFLDGCWEAERGIVEEKTGLKLRVTYCFDNGRGTRTEIFEDGAKCRGSLTARRDQKKVVIDGSAAPCEGAHGRFVPIRVVCHSGEGDEAICDEFSEGSDKPAFHDHPFYKTTHQ